MFRNDQIWLSISFVYKYLLSDFKHFAENYPNNLIGTFEFLSCGVFSYRMHTRLLFFFCMKILMHTLDGEFRVLAA